MQFPTGHCMVNENNYYTAVEALKPENKHWSLWRFFTCEYGHFKREKDWMPKKRRSTSTLVVFYEISTIILDYNLFVKLAQPHWLSSLMQSKGINSHT